MSPAILIQSSPLTEPSAMYVPEPLWLTRSQTSPSGVEICGPAEIWAVLLRVATHSYCEKVPLEM